MTPCGSSSLVDLVARCTELISSSVPTGSSIYSTEMTGESGSDIYYAKVEIASSELAMITVSNIDDATASELAVTDAVTITSVEYDGTELVVKASSSYNAATLTSNYGGPLTADAAGVLQCTWIGTALPLTVIVSSDGGDSATKNVKLAGDNFERIEVVP